MALSWRVAVVTMADAESGTGPYEPFAVVDDEVRGPCVVVKGLVEMPDDPKATDYEEAHQQLWLPTE